MNFLPIHIMPLIVVIGCILLFIGFVIGKIHERIEWNKLITKGILPTPRSARK